MSHLIDPCLRATKIAHGIRRGIDGLSPLSGLVPELRILIQEQKNVLTSLKRTAFEKEEAAKHLAIYAKTEGPDIADTLSKLAILIQKAADLERSYSNSLGESRERFKEIRVAEDEQYNVRKRKLDLEQKLAQAQKGSGPYALTDGTTSTASVGSTNTTATSSSHQSKVLPELHQEMKLLRQKTLSVENDLEDLKRKKIKKATSQQLDALEKLGKELIVIAHYGRGVMAQLDDSPTPAGTHADERYAEYDGTAKTAYTVKACMDTFKSWPEHAPLVKVKDIDMGDYPKDTKEAMDAMLKDLAIKSGSDWYDLQKPVTPTLTTGGNPPPLPAKDAHRRTDSVSSTTSPSTKSQRDSISSAMTTKTYVDGVPMVTAINEIPPTPDVEAGPILEGAVTPTAEPIPVFVASEEAKPAPVTKDHEPAKVSSSSSSEPVAGVTSPPSPSLGGASPFVPHTSYKPATTYHASHPSEGRVSPTHRPRPISGEYSHATHAPHPLMMPAPVQQGYPPHQQQPYHILPTHMPVPMPVMPMNMPVPHIPTTMDPSQPLSPSYEGGYPKRTSQPISVSFPNHPSTGSSSSPPPPQRPLSAEIPQGRRNPHAVLPPAEPGFRLPVGYSPPSSPGIVPPNSGHAYPHHRHSGNPQEVPVEDAPAVYDGPPPDYTESSMLPPAEKRDEKQRGGGVVRGGAEGKGGGSSTRRP